jgi:hypothetical protein
LNSKRKTKERTHHKTHLQQSQNVTRSPRLSTPQRHHPSLQFPCPHLRHRKRLPHPPRPRLHNLVLAPLPFLPNLPPKNARPPLRHRPRRPRRPLPLRPLLIPESTASTPRPCSQTSLEPKPLSRNRQTPPSQTGTRRYTSTKHPRRPSPTPTTPLRHPHSFKKKNAPTASSPTAAHSSSTAVLPARAPPSSPHRPATRGATGSQSSTSRLPEPSERAPVCAARSGGLWTPGRGPGVNGGRAERERWYWGGREGV